MITQEQALLEASNLLDFASGFEADDGLPKYWATGEHNPISREVENCMRLASVLIEYANAVKDLERRD